MRKGALQTLYIHPYQIQPIWASLLWALIKKYMRWNLRFGIHMSLPPMYSSHCLSHALLQVPRRLSFVRAAPGNNIAHQSRHSFCKQPLLGVLSGSMAKQCRVLYIHWKVARTHPLKRNRRLVLLAPLPLIQDFHVWGSKSHYELQADCCWVKHNTIPQPFVLHMCEAPHP